MKHRTKNFRIGVNQVRPNIDADGRLLPGTAPNANANANAAPSPPHRGTIIESDSDRWVVTQLGASSLFDLLRPSLPWNSLMDRVMTELHLQGKSIDDIANSLKEMFLDPHIVSAIKSAHSIGCDLRVVSDANLFFIETVLKHHDIFDCFTNIYTNPSFVDEERKLRIMSFHNSISPHGCALCPPNMCKGKIIEKIISSGSSEGRKNIIYIGDGKGDYCPSLKLCKEDYVMPRDKYPLSVLISDNADLVKATVHRWSNGEEIERILSELISKLSGRDQANNNNSQSSSGECKLEAIPVSSEEGYSVAIQVPQ